MVAVLFSDQIINDISTRLGTTLARHQRTSLDHAGKASWAESRRMDTVGHLKMRSKRDVFFETGGALRYEKNMNPSEVALDRRLPRPRGRLDIGNLNFPVAVATII